MFIKNRIAKLLSHWCERKLIKAAQSHPYNFKLNGYLVANISGELFIGRNVCFRSTFHNMMEIDVARNASLIIKDRVFVNQGTRIVCTKKISIGLNVLIGDEVLIIDNDFHAMENGAIKNEAITIGDNVWVASRVIILGGVTIGDGCVIGAGSVVTKSIPSNSFAAGAPARVLKSIQRERPRPE